MGTFTSTNFCETSTLGYEGLIEHDRGTEQIVIKEPLISDLTVATARAKAEFLNNGYSEKVIDITTIHITGLKQNDIFNFKGQNWIIKEISLSFKTPKLTQVIKGVRYV